MKDEHTSPPTARAAWITAALAGAIVPTLALLRLGDTPETLALVAGPLLALALMGGAMLGAAAGGRLWPGVIPALIGAVGLILLARALGMAPLPHPLSTGLAMLIASISFAARGTLFARAYACNGWLLALFVVGGEAAMLITAAMLPPWLLTLLPAQWASTAIQTAITGTGTRAAGSALIALAGTAATTLLVARLLPRRWPYLLMFTAWIALSALVWQRPAPPVPRADLAASVIAPPASGALIGGVR